MWLDVIEYYNFYQTDLGAMCHKLIARKIRHIWPSVHHKRILGYGYTHPYLGIFQQEADRVLSAMPAPLGVVAWPEAQMNRAVLVEENLFPFPDRSLDYMLVVHAFEHTDSPTSLLREMWRVLADDGRALLIVPNRRGLWASTVATPFGYGHPYTGRQLYDVINDSLFLPSKPIYSLYPPPFRSFLNTQFYESIESVGEKGFKKLGGVVLLEMQKQVLCPPRKKILRRWVPHIFIPRPMGTIRSTARGQNASMEEGQRTKFDFER